MAEAEADIAAFAAGHDAEALVALFAATFEHINRARDRVMAGITRYAHKQEALEARIEELRGEFATPRGGREQGLRPDGRRREGARLVDADLPATGSRR